MRRHSLRSPLTVSAIVLLPLLLTGCEIFAPRYNTSLETSVLAADEKVETIAANVALGNYKDKESYETASNSYAEALGKLTVAERQAQALRARGELANRQRNNLVTIIKGCSTEVSNLADTHHQFGLKPNTGATDSMTVACDRALRAVRAQKK